MCWGSARISVRLLAKSYLNVTPPIHSKPQVFVGGAFGWVDATFLTHPILRNTCVNFVAFDLIKEKREAENPRSCILASPRCLCTHLALSACGYSLVTRASSTGHLIPRDPRYFMGLEWRSSDARVTREWLAAEDRLALHLWHRCGHAIVTSRRVFFSQNIAKYRRNSHIINLPSAQAAESHEWNGIGISIIRPTFQTGALPYFWHFISEVSES